MVRVSKFYTMAISALLALLGFSGAGCGNSSGHEPLVEYGTPWASFKVKGIVESESDNTPIEGIRAMLVQDITDTSPITTAAYTNSKGSFSLGCINPSSLKLYVILTDMDGSVNGSFASKQIVVDFSDVPLTGGSGWYDGEAALDLGNIKMQSE
ncbi:MAG: radical SAM-associated putative lipoprotein [Treponema sp.]|nr:radical SAM-associated putative lipoprotein [Treponema sp.]